MTSKDIPGWIKEHHVFYQWWKKHRHSGYVEDKNGRAHWGDEPWVAYRCDLYRVEFSVDTGTPYETKHNYTAEEIEGWAEDQREHEDYVGGDYGCIDTKNFMAAIGRASSKLAVKFAVVEAKLQPEERKAA